jgi:NitT/TauT family transport system substrate-binding protein
MHSSSGYSLFRSLRCLALLVVCLAGTLAAEDTRTYRIGMCPWIAWSPTHVAEATGIWKDLGVQVEVVNQIGEEEHLLAVAHRQVDFSIDMIGNLVGMYENGIDVTIMAELDWSHGGDKVLARDASAIAKNARVGVYHKDPAVLMFVDAFLRSHSLTLTDVTISQHEPSDLTGLFIANRLDLVFTYDP